MQGASTTTTSFRANTQNTSIKALAWIYQGFIEVLVMQGASTTTTGRVTMALGRLSRQQQGCWTLRAGARRTSHSSFRYLSIHP